jgi:hypothetical protein
MTTPVYRQLVGVTIENEVHLVIARVAGKTCPTWRDLFEVVKGILPSFTYDEEIRILKCFLVPMRMLHEITYIALGAYFRLRGIGLPETPDIWTIMDQPYESWLGLKGRCELYVYLAPPGHSFMTDTKYTVRTESVVGCIEGGMTIMELENMYALICQSCTAANNAFNGLDTSKWVYPRDIDTRTRLSDERQAYLTTYPVVYKLSDQVRELRSQE